MKELLMMEPVFKEAIWGGSRLKEVYGYDIPKRAHRGVLGYQRTQKR